MSRAVRVARAREADRRAALVAARRLLRSERLILLECLCVRGPDGRPDRTTLDEGDAREIARFDRAIDTINAALRT